MDYKKIEETKSQLNNLSSRLQMLEELQKETVEKIYETQNSCTHELIIISKKYENKAYEYLQYGKCLVCGKGITLTPNNINSDTNELVNSDNVIDIVDDIEMWMFDCDCSKCKSELEEAQKIFDDMTINSGVFYTKDCIKNEIINGVNSIKRINKLEKNNK